MRFSAITFVAHRVSAALGCNPGPPPQGRTSPLEEEEEEEEERERERLRQRYLYLYIYVYVYIHIAHKLSQIGAAGRCLAP